MMASILFGIGPEAMTFPLDIRSMALSGTGAAGGCSTDVNPAMINDLPKISGIEFTRHTWYADISGMNIRYRHLRKIPIIVDLTNWNSGDIGQWGEVPQDDPIGTISLHWVSAGLTTGFMKNGWNIGIGLKGHFGRMVIESVKGVTLDAGILRPITPNLRIGVAMKNLGSFSSTELDITSPVNLSAGIQLNESFTGVNILADVVQEKSHGTYFRAGLEKSFKNIILMSGATLSPDKFQYSLGTAYSIGQWKFGYGVAFHQNDILGTPQSFTISKKLN